MTQETLHCALLVAVLYASMSGDSWYLIVDPDGFHWADVRPPMHREWLRVSPTGEVEGPGNRSLGNVLGLTGK